MIVKRLLKNRINNNIFVINNRKNLSVESEIFCGILMNLTKKILGMAVEKYFSESFNTDLTIERD